jgi:hypothetical protein
MEKIKFNNKVFEYSLIGYIISLLCWNLYAIGKGNLIGMIPIGIQTILLFLLLTKNKYVKNGIKFWAIILILSHGISFLAMLGKFLLVGETIISELLNKAIFLTIGILIYVFNERFVELVKSEKTS